MHFAISNDSTLPPHTQHPKTSIYEHHFSKLTAAGRSPDEINNLPSESDNNSGQGLGFYAGPALVLNNSNDNDHNFHNQLLREKFRNKNCKVVPGFSISIVDTPPVVQNGKEIYGYIIEIKAEKYKYRIYQTYNDFYTFLSILKNHFGAKLKEDETMPLPLLPSRDLFSKNDLPFVLSKKKELELFLEVLSEHPFLTDGNNAKSLAQLLISLIPGSLLGHHGYELLDELKARIQVLLDLLMSNSEFIVFQNNQDGLRLTFSIEKILTHGLRGRNAIFTKKYFWVVFEKLKQLTLPPLPTPHTNSSAGEIMSLETMLVLTEDVSKNNAAKGRVFLRLALNNNCLSFLLSHLFEHKMIINELYENGALLQNEEHRTIFLLLLETLDRIPFSMWVKERALADPDYYLHIFRILDSKAKEQHVVSLSQSSPAVPVFNSPSSSSSPSPLSISSSATMQFSSSPNIQRGDSSVVVTVVSDIVSNTIEDSDDLISKEFPKDHSPLSEPHVVTSMHTLPSNPSTVLHANSQSKVKRERSRTLSSSDNNVLKVGEVMQNSLWSILCRSLIPDEQHAHKISLSALSRARKGPPVTPPSPSTSDDIIIPENSPLSEDISPSENLEISENIEGEIPLAYFDLCELPTKYEREIESDIHRVLTKVNFNTGEGPLILRRILTAFTLYYPSLGYTQELSLISANLLLQLDEEGAFWVLLWLTKKYSFEDKYLFSTNLEFLRICCFALEKLLFSLHPDVFYHLKSHGFAFTFILSDWFSTLFVYSSPSVNYLFRIWDVLFLEERDYLFRMAIAIIRICRERILKLDDLQDIVTLLKDSLKIIPVDMLLKEARELSQLPTDVITSFFDEFLTKQIEEASVGLVSP